MKMLVAYYSRTCTTKKVGDEIAAKLKADKEEVIDRKNRKGAIGYMIGGKDAMSKKLTKINNLKKNPKNYELLIVGTPVWGFTVTPAIRTFLTQIKDYNKKAAFFCTMGGSGDERTFNEMQKLLPKAKLIATLALRTIEVKNNKYGDKLSEFIKKIKNG